ncbi:MAG: biopolymer transporter ExbD [Methylococcaceae bacterium]|nr:biopolymer transporter ExbD [Methylococcaceae bacterium]
MNFSSKKRTPIEVSLTPMIDVVFLLLIFFMVTTTFDQQSAIKINLPEANGESSKHEKKYIMLTINAEGTYFISDDEGLSHQLINQKTETLKRALIKAAGKSRAIPFVISADGKTPHQSVVTAIDIAAALGFARVTFATKAIPES